MRGVKLQVSAEEMNVRNSYHCGMYARTNLDQGVELNVDMFDIVQPLGGNDSLTSIEFMGMDIKKLNTPIKSGDQLKRWMIDV